MDSFFEVTLRVDFETKYLYVKESKKYNSFINVIYGTYFATDTNRMVRILIVTFQDLVSTTRLNFILFYFCATFLEIGLG